MKLWTDVSSPPHAHFLLPIIKEYRGREDSGVLVTARDFGSVLSILDKAGVEYTKVGEHGGEGLEGKLLRSAERIKKLTEIVSEEEPDIGIGKHSVEGPRVSFGLGIPWITVLDHETAKIQNKLMLPLSDKVVTPDIVDEEFIRSYTDAEVVQFYGVCESDGYFDTEKKEDVLGELGLDPDDTIVISRAEPYLSSHVYHKSRLYNTLKELIDRRDVEVVFIPRNRKDREKFSELDVIIPDGSVPAFELYRHSNLMLGAGCCMNREACMCGVPTVSMYPDDLPAPDRFLIRKGLLVHTLDEGEALDLCEDFLDNNKERELKLEELKKELENPYDVITRLIDRMYRENSKSP